MGAPTQYGNVIRPLFRTKRTGSDTYDNFSTDRRSETESTDGTKFDWHSTTLITHTFACKYADLSFHAFFPLANSSLLE